MAKVLKTGDVVRAGMKAEEDAARRVLAGGRLQDLPLRLIMPTPDNPRKFVKDQAFKELVENVKKHGILQPGIARPHPQESGYYDLRAGERRFRAAVDAGLAAMPVIVRDLSDQEAMEITVIENMHRKDLTPIEEAKGVQRLLDVGKDPEVIAAEIGKDKRWVLRRARLSSLTRDWVLAAEEHSLPAAHLELIARYTSEQQDDLYHELVSVSYMLDEMFFQSGSLDALKTNLASRHRELAKVPWDLNDAVLYPIAGACSTCTKRSSCNPELFDHDRSDAKKKPGDTCLDADCFNHKMRVHNDREEQRLVEKHPNALKVHDGYGIRRGVLGLGEYERVNKTEPGAVPALLLSDDGPSKLIHIKPKVESRAAKKAAATASSDPASKLKEKMEQLERRRWAFVTDTVLEHLLKKDDLPAERYYQSARGMLDLVCAFETGGHIGVAMSADYDHWSGLLKLRKKDEGVSVAVVWEKVRPKIYESLRYYQTSGITQDHIDDLYEACTLLGLDVNKMKAEADEAIPVPKSSAKLDADAKPEKAKRSKPAKADDDASDD